MNWIFFQQEFIEKKKYLVYTKNKIEGVSKVETEYEREKNDL